MPALVDALELVKLARRHLGEKYVLGCLAPKDNPGWKGPWDCAEFCSWLVYQTSGRLYGCRDNHGNPSVTDAYTGYWARDAERLGERISVEEAVAIPGAMLLRVPAGDRGGHIALSDGEGGTLEAYSSKRGVIAFRASGRVWDMGILTPGYSYRKPSEAVTYKPARQTVLRLTMPNMTGPCIRELQKALRAAGFNPGPADGSFGPLTLAAVLAFQQAKGLAPDGVVGPQTARALGIQLPRT